MAFSAAPEDEKRRGSLQVSLDDDRVSTSARSAPASLLHPWKGSNAAVATAFHGGCRTNRSANRCVNQSWGNACLIARELACIWDDAHETAEINGVHPTVARAT